MDKNKKLGQEPAFASQSKSSTGNSINTSIQTGMSKRLYIATEIAAGILSNPVLRNDILMDSKTTLNNNPRLSSEGYLVKNAYQYADELLKQEDK